jgi:hypothetical protein
MTDGASRRRFLFRHLADPPPDGWDLLFGGYEDACAQVNEARPFLADEARRLGIATEGRSDLDILKDVFRSTGPPDGWAATKE